MYQLLTATPYKLNRPFSSLDLVDLLPTIAIARDWELYKLENDDSECTEYHNPWHLIGRSASYYSWI